MSEIITITTTTIIGTIPMVLKTKLNNKNTNIYYTNNKQIKTRANQKFK